MIVITVARKPLEGTVAANVLKWGTGSINIDKIRIRHTEDFSGVQGFASMKLNAKRAGESHDDWMARVKGGPEQQASLAKLPNLGRWPANLILSEAAAKGLDEQSGIVATGTWNRQKDTAHPFGNAKDTPYETWQAVTEPAGGASRYFKLIKGD